MLDRLQKILEEAASNGRLQAIRKRMEQGKAAFTDTAEYSDRLSNLLGEILSANVEQLTQPKEKETICKQLLQAHYESINKVLSNVQLDLDQQREIHIRPQQAAFPAERVQKVAHALEDPTVSLDTIRRRANAPVANVAKSFYDDYIRENAKFRANAGLKCWIVRTTDGNCCKWCTKMAGRYAYGSEPSDVYRRHDNCGCTVIYENGKQRQNVWSKKQWEVPEAGAGAPKPTILTPAQGRALQEKHKPTALTRGSGSGIMKKRDVKSMIRAIEQPIEQQHTGKGNPNAILTFDVSLNNRQSTILAQLVDYNSRITVPKKDINMADLSAFTAKTGHEFAMFTKGQKRLIIRGNGLKVEIDLEQATELAAVGYRWSGHTHPGETIGCLMPSSGDKAVLAVFKQDTSVIYNSKGQFATFGKEE